MKIYALVGSSGTGKSHKAMALASDLEIDFIIDDGLLINDNKKLAGKSAKREKTTIGAVKRALFFKDDHKLDVVETLKMHQPEKLLLIGTSDNMVEKIAKRLDVGPIDRIVYIDEISTEDEIKLAKEMRMLHGKHVIPVPTLEIKKDFSGYFLDPLKVFRRHKKGEHMEFSEKTVVRPTFSYLGKYTISNKTISQIISHVANKLDGVYKTTKIKLVKTKEGSLIDVEIIFDIHARVHLVAHEIQENVKKEFEHMTQMHIIEVNVHAKTCKG